MVNMYLERCFLAHILLTYVTVVFYCCVFGEAVAGGRSSVPTNSAAVQQAALFAVIEYNKVYSKQMTAFKISSIISAESQVVAGFKYFLKVKLGLTRCSKNTTGAALQSCPLKAHGMVLLCNFVVIEIPWESVELLVVNGCTKLSG
ncbi:hypothetical protein P4O66_012589 [Electrophorus voltai]|uniref:Cystatin domain-containing protein n=1 Tax=Electrophorus voltai TaxID=2609070 RepID=A0AAD8Z787_9TELE|nr:hypothetical protein P4O66_012589 [Electrophorus voltai]